VRNQSQQVGIVMPQVAVYHAPDINAFATGARRDASLVAVSTGLLKNMNRDEAEAVIAHEISHIANGDMVTMTLMQGVVNTFVIFISRLLAQVISGFISGNRDEESSSAGNSMVYLAVSVVLELVFGVLASIITMWFSRYREFHADAGSARLVGREKMIAALQRLKTSYEPQEAGSIMAFCINGKHQSFSELFMSHPPLEKRIEALRSGQYLN
jgi:heat shock protein HtpX